ncbi:flavin monoamine oxidase family protein [Sphingomonas sp. IC4-52]|uniref:flavin monoamine oxidase family protein n=1 Tax=Sphingomonas sp. IC4-52 TaxID=2887202 RepID=UPI001D0FDCA0|nr:NAD(P)/FAD-dependent oxidoreductase [Sphingomonas sp. IC4-52]MCC2980832.1 FAD-dependent oxidoreductase [Sphingomonas sp. IC4-52]
MKDEVDVVIVGGGAAGIAAGRWLTDAGRSVLIIEALPRLGGRAHTVMLGGYPVDLGCGWLHSAERNPLSALAKSHGVAVDRSKAAWGDQLGAINFPKQAQQEAWQAYEAFTDRLAKTPPASDRASDALTEWQPFINGLSSFINGVETDRLSARDFTAYDDAASDNNWRLPDGYGAFIAALGRDVPIMLDTPVSAIRAGVVETGRGAIRSHSVIVTVSTEVLTHGAIRFPSAAADHLHAATQLPLGLGDKLFLSLADPEAVPAESHLLGRFDDEATGSYYLRPFGRPIIECFLGGAHARALEQGAAVDFAIGELRALLGADFAKGLRPLLATRWAKEPTILGSYSHALPGHAGARATLARPINDWLCLAGEACSPHDFSTAHGAWQSGIVAARHVHQAMPQ